MRRSSCWAVQSRRALNASLPAAASSFIRWTGRPGPSPIGLHEAGASKYESTEKNRENLRRTKRRERSGATAKDTGEKGQTKSELYAEARRRKIPGRSKMDKGELERAVSAH